jgi:GxxExxY protein
VNVHKALGPGFLEGIYRRALLVELEESGLLVESEKEVAVHFKGREIGVHRLDLLVENEIIVELKAVEELTRHHYAQIKSYLKATGLSVGLLVNFSKDKSDFRRVEWS